MRIFESYWNNFLVNDKYSGIAFEDLIEELLSLMYGKKWLRTPKTHDGNRDFYLNINNNTLWAECKNYRDHISLKTLAPTLVMAQICDANTILFFSRSEINHFAKEKITTYGYKTHKQTIFYDGELLEKLIIKYNELLSLKYQLRLEELDTEANLNTIFKVSEFFFPSIISKMVTSADDDFISYRSVEKLHYNEIFSLLITIINNASANATVEISFSEVNRDRFFYEYLDNNIYSESNIIKKINLKPGESTAISFNLRVTKFKNELLLPNFHVKYMNNDNQTCEWNSEIKKVICEWVGETKLIGHHYNHIIEMVKDRLVNNIEFSALLLTGSSGMGKSRILKECCCPLLANGYRILEINVTKEHSTANFIKDIIYFLYEVPSELVTQIIIERIEGKAYEGLSINIDMVTRIAHMIDSLDDDLEIFMEQYKELLFQELSKKKIALIIDNIQFASPLFQQFWQSYIDFSVNQVHTNKTIFLISVNLDYMSEESAKFIYLLQNSNIKHFVNEFIDGFKDINQGLLFLRELTYINNEDCDELFKKIIDSVSLNPFNLYQMVKFLEESEIIKHPKNMQGYLLTTEATLKTAMRIPKNINDVLKSRFDFIFLHIEKSSFALILSSCYLFENLDDTLIELLDISKSDLTYLVEHQIIIQTENGYHFIHDIIRKYYEQYGAHDYLYCLRGITSPDKLQYYEDVFKLYKLCVLKNEEYMIELCNKQDLSSISVRLQKIFLEKLFDLCIENRNIQKKMSFWLDSLCWICNSTRNVLGSEKALQYHKRVFSYLDNQHEYFSEFCGIELRRLLHSHCDIYIQMNQRGNAITFANKVINKLSLIPDKNDNTDEYYVIKAIMYNRIYCSYNNAYPTVEIKQERTDALNKSRLLISCIKDEAKRNLITYLNNSDEGYCFYGFYSDYSKLMQKWNLCLVDISIFAPEKTMNYYRKQVQCHLINQDYEGVTEYIMKGRDYLKNGEYSHEPLIFNTFFIMSEIINHLQHFPGRDYSYIEILIDKLTQMQLILKNNKLADIYLLKGINAFYTNNIEMVYHTFKMAYLEYNRNETSYYWIKRELMRENIITAYAILNINGNNHDVSFLSHDCIEKILSFLNTDFEAKGIIRTNDKLFNLPLVI